MKLKDRIKSFAKLGDKIDNIPNDQFDELALSAQNQNNWFVKENIQEAFSGITKFLKEENLNQWLSNYTFGKSANGSIKIGVIAAGNIPMVGFHDVLSVLVSGHSLMLKMSSDDAVLMNYVLNLLFEVEPSYKDRVEVVERLNDADAYIATGSDNSARYFKYYFKEKPNVIRQNRSSAVVLTGNESIKDIQNLGRDIFQYYGLGCRNISKAFVPEGYDFKFMLDNLQEWEWVGDHHKYRNNYDYNKSIYLVNKEPHLDNGFMLIRESVEMVSPISVLYYQQYTHDRELQELLQANESKIQCVVGAGDGFIPFGQAQHPEVWDYADGVDTIEFLISL